MLAESLLADLIHDIPNSVRLQRLVNGLQNHFHCGAVALLRLEQDSLRPLTITGLVNEALGRRFKLAQHPRLATIIGNRQAVRFDPDSPLDDPYDGLLLHQPGEALPVHDCMGISVYVDGIRWGALTLDSLTPGVFDQDTLHELQRCNLLVEATVRMGQIERDLRALRQARQHDGLSPLPVNEGNLDIIGCSEPLLAIKRELEVVANSDLPVLLLGETGVGKELFARFLHQHSLRQDKPLIYINCAALPESLAESELFGHQKGAFSGATQDRAGRFDAADQGTLFLDEVGELPLSIQAKLLRVLQNGEIQRLGSDKFRRVDVRIVAATNRDLKAQVKAGEFRADLYHRLSVYPLPIPPLRERSSDISLLAGHFLELNRSRLGLRSVRLSMDAEHALQQYPWPGNIRELEHVISRAAIKALSQGAQRQDIITIDRNLLDLDITPGNHSQQALTATLNASEPLSVAMQVSLKEATQLFQAHVIRQQLELHHYSWSNTARALQLDPSNLHKLAHRLGLK